MESKHKYKSTYNKETEKKLDKKLEVNNNENIALKSKKYN